MSEKKDYNFLQPTPPPYDEWKKLPQEEVAYWGRLNRLFLHFNALHNGRNSPFSPGEIRNIAETVGADCFDRPDKYLTRKI